MVFLGKKNFFCLRNFSFFSIKEASTTQKKIVKPEMPKKTLKKFVKNDVIELFTQDFDYLLLVPLSQVAYLPPADKAVRRKGTYVLCPTCSQHGDASQCLQGSKCKYVHADVTNCDRELIHINYTWPSVEFCKYEHLAPGKVFNVSAPNSRPPCVQIPSERILATRGALAQLAAGEDPCLSHCAHYYFNRACNRGANCAFVHILHVDATASLDKMKRAPAGVVESAITRPISKPKEHVHFNAPGPIGDEKVNELVSFRLPLQYPAATTAAPRDMTCSMSKCGISSCTPSDEDSGYPNSTASASATSEEGPVLMKNKVRKYRIEVYSLVNPIKEVK